MYIKQFFIAGLLSGMVMFFIAGLWHEWVMAAFYENEMHASYKGTGIIFLAYLVLGFLMVYFYSRSFRKKIMDCGLMVRYTYGNSLGIPP